MTNRFERALYVLMLLLLTATAVRAQEEPEPAESLDDPKTEAAAFDIAQRTMSPFCPGRTLADCPSDKAAAWRQDIRRMLAEGRSAAEIRRELNQRSGLNLTGTPESSIGWMLPVGLLVGAGGILALVIARFRKDEDAEPEKPNTNRDDEDDEDDEDDGERSPSAAAAADDELEARLRRELEDED